MSRPEPPPFDPTTDKLGRRWIAEPGQPLWTLQIHDELALAGAEQLERGESRPITCDVEGQAYVGQLLARRRVDGQWWGLCLLSVEWGENTWQQRLSWQPASVIVLTDL